MCGIINDMTYKDVFIYNKKSGVLKWKSGKVAGCKDFYGYLIVGYNRKLLKVHRVIWEMRNGKIPDGLVIDHINRNPADNRFCNLRLVTKAQNAYNAKTRGDNKFSQTGVSWNKDKQKYKAYITVDKKQLHLGYFDTVAAAVKARKQKEKETPQFLGG